MAQDILVSLGILSIEKEISETLNLTEITQEFATLTAKKCFSS